MKRTVGRSDRRTARRWLVLMILLSVSPTVRLSGQGDTVPPYLAFPQPGLDDPAAYEGYETRVYRDASANAFQVYVHGSSGRVVNLWADAANESVGFTVRDSSGKPAELAWGSSGAAVAASARTRSVSYGLEAPSEVRIGLFLLGSMRVERDFQYAGRDSLPLDAAPFPQPELSELIDHIATLPAAERARHLLLLGVKTIAALRARLSARITARLGDTAWVVEVEQVSFDGRSHLWLALEGDARETVPAISGNIVTIRRPAGGPVRLSVRVTTDAPALTPLTRAEIFNDEFRGFAAQVRADTAHPLRFRLLEREVRGVELLSYREKLMAGLPNFATYFGRDMLMTALLMEPVWSDSMPEHVIASALRKLSAGGDVSHEEALGGQAIREHAAEYNRLVREHQLARARDALAHLADTRENYHMVDDDLQLPAVAARYLGNPHAPAERKRRFLTTRVAPSGPSYLALLCRNLAFVAGRLAPYAREPVPTNLVGFSKLDPHWWRAGSWRDSRVGYANGRFALDVNVVWAPLALQAIGAIGDALSQLGFSAAALDSVAPELRAGPLGDYLRRPASLRRAVATWHGAVRHFEVMLPPAEVSTRLAAWLRSLPPAEHDFWSEQLARHVPVIGTLRFLALSLDARGRPVPVMSTDPGMLLFLGDPSPERFAEALAPFRSPYPLGLFVAGLGPLVANDAFATADVWEMFRQDQYHSPRVVWGREVNILLAALARRLGSAPDSNQARVLRETLDATLAAVERSGLRHAELWSYRIEAGSLLPTRFGTSSDVQLWSLTDLAVQYLLNHPGP